MNHRYGESAPRRRHIGRPAVLLAAVLVIAVASTFSSGCGGLLSSSRASSDNENLAATKTSISRTTTTTLSLHEQIQQEQAGRGEATTTSNTEPGSETTSSTSGTASSTTLASVVFLSDGSTISLEELDAIQSYVTQIDPLAEEQSELAAALDPDSSFVFGNVTPEDVKQYSESIRRQKVLGDELADVQAPAYMAESHQLRILAAQQIYQAATTMLGEIMSGKHYPEDSPAMAAGRSQFEVGLDTLTDAEFGLVLWEQAVDGAYIE